MDKNTITLTESELHQMVNECVASMLEEGFIDNMKAAWQGAKRGYQGQQMLDRGVDDFKQQWDREDLANQANPWATKPENTTDVQAREAYKRYKEYQQEANKYLNLYNRLTKKYGLQKTDVGQVKSNQKSNFAGNGGVQTKRNKFGSSVRARQRNTNPIGLFGK